MPQTRDQRIAARIALSARRGKTPKSKLRGASLSMYKSMSTRQLEDFAKGPLSSRKHMSAR